VCRAAFIDSAEDRDEQLDIVRKTWPLAVYKANAQKTKAVADLVTASPLDAKRPLSLHVPGTNFQVAVWRALLRIPAGTAVSYSHIAEAVGSPRAVRAAGTAIGANPVAFLIPCHRVIQQSGALGGYRWGPVRKEAMQVWEKVRTSEDAAAK
jgi:AraC family transcriptional regulator of adaptative response/methylated-DNA-[protein]-cysteine methyltransferase